MDCLLLYYFVEAGLHLFFVGNRLLADLYMLLERPLLLVANGLSYFRLCVPLWLRRFWSLPPFDQVFLRLSILLGYFGCDLQPDIVVSLGIVSAPYYF